MASPYERCNSEYSYGGDIAADTQDWPRIDASSCFVLAMSPPQSMQEQSHRHGNTSVSRDGANLWTFWYSVIYHLWFYGMQELWALDWVMICLYKSYIWHTTKGILSRSVHHLLYAAFKEANTLTPQSRRFILLRLPTWWIHSHMNRVIWTVQ